MVAAISTQQKSSFFIKGRARLLFLVFLIAFALFLAAGIHYGSATQFAATNNSPLTITGAPGELISTTVHAGSSVNGHWASQGGLTLTLNSPSNFSTQLVAPHERDWSDSISTSLSNPDSDIVLTGSFVIPSTINLSARSLSGQITGDVEFPDDLGYGFTEGSTQVHVPVQLVLIDYSTVFLTVQLPLYLVTGLGVVVLLAFPAFFRLADARRKSPFATL